jgi:catechol-2,3-dioxygenase
MGSSWSNVVVDATDPARLARWWAEVLDFRLTHEAADEVCIAGDCGPELVFVPVPEAKSGKNRLHLDVRPDDQAAEVERLIDMGARQIDIGQSQDAAWVVLTDPEGNEFCVLPAKEG